MTHAPTHMDRPAGLYSASERRQWAALQAVPVYREQLYNAIEFGSCGSVDSCPVDHMGGQTGGFDVGRLAEQLPGAAWYETITSPTTWVITIIGLMSTINFVGLLWHYCKARRNTGCEEMKTTVTVNNTTTRPSNAMSIQAVVSEPALPANVSRCGVAEVSEMMTFPMEVSAPATPTNKVMLATKPVYYY